MHSSSKLPLGKVVAIIGPSGSGKGTLLKLLQGIYRPAGGTIKSAATTSAISSANELWHCFDVVPQETVPLLSSAKC